MCGVAGTCADDYNDPQQGACANFDGNSDMFDLPSTPDFVKMPGFTVAVRVNTFPATLFMCVIGKRYGNGTASSWRLCIDSSEVIHSMATSAGAIMSAQWHHLVR